MREKPVRISGHARFEMGRRGISEAHRGRGARPGQMILSRKGRQIFQTKIAGGRMLLRVVGKEVAPRIMS